MGTIHAFGIEGTGSYGAGIARFLTYLGYCVVEVDRPDRSTRYRKSKSGPTDAEMAARAVLAGVADAVPKSGQGEVEMIRMLKSAKDSAVKARTQAINQMKAPIVTAPADLRETLYGLSVSALAARWRRFRVHCLRDPTAAAKYALRCLAWRHHQISEEIRNLKAELAQLIGTASPTLINIVGVGPDTAATLLIVAGSNPEGLRSAAAFDALCGVCPIPASSGKINRHRLNRGCDRQANAALHRRGNEQTRSDALPQTVRRARDILSLTDARENGQQPGLTSIGASFWSYYASVGWAVMWTFCGMPGRFWQKAS